jgi:sulfoxide reductase catalytic subunit YedY
MADRLQTDQVTPEHLYLSRRKFIKGLIATAGAAAVAGCAPGQTEQLGPPAAETAAVPAEAEPTATGEAPESPEATATSEQTGASTWPTVSAEQDEMGDALTPQESVNNYNNYYEFSLEKQAVAPLSREFVATPWSVQVGGLVENPRTFDLASLYAFAQEERIYRMRCVEAWSMVIPWIGFPLARLLEEVKPAAEAQYVRFETLYDPDRLPGQQSSLFDWPYVEGLRLDEAMHDLTILATGLYGKPLLPQTGAPVRLVVPWKYGFKSIKSIVRIDLVAEMPTTFWMAGSPSEYGFYANVNPDVPHPRWSQASERRIGETGRRRTLIHNGYGDQVANLYEGMDLNVWF